MSPAPTAAPPVPTGDARQRPMPTDGAARTTAVMSPLAGLGVDLAPSATGALIVFPFQIVGGWFLGRLGFGIAGDALKQEEVTTGRGLL